MTLSFIDSHAHLAAPDFSEDIEQVVKRAKDAGLSHIITVGAGYGKQSAQDALKLAENYDCIYATVGLHPCDSEYKIESSWLKDLTKHDKVKALGETGLDFYWNKTDPEIQIYNFKIHIEVAKETGLPIVVHSRNAANECLKILEEMKAQEVGGVFHCYSENSDFAKKLEDINFLVSFPAILTFKNAGAAREAAKEIALNRIMIETDCPYLAPQRVRGKRCEPAYVVDVASTLAEVKGITLDEVARVTSENAKRFFKLNS